MDRAEASRIAHGELPLWNPLGEHALDEAIGLLDLPPGATVLDVGAGRGEVLRRVSDRWEVRGTGYDSDPALVEGTTLELRDEPPPGAFELVICVASSHALGGFPDALHKLRELTVPGGRLLLGEGYWRRAPSDEYLDALGGAGADELPDYGGLLRAAEEAGLVPVHASVASEADWDRYEWRLILNSERSGLPELRERAEAARRRLALPGGRETLGFALVLLERRCARAANRPAHDRV
jgi:SAM-dependent methyltransferase